MQAMEAVSYLVFGTYLAIFLALTAATAKLSGRPVWLLRRGPPGQRITALLFRIAFAGAALWPLQRWLLDGRLIAGDPLHRAMDGLSGDILGHVLLAVGALVAAMAQMHMGQSWRIGAAEGETGAMVEDGPFALSRNPVFLGQMLLFAGLFLVFPDLVQAGLTLVLLVAIHWQVRLEEQVLAADHGEAYRAYCRRVPRWLGRPRPA